VQRYQADDRERVQDALRRVDLEGFADRSVLSLSGGERQRVFLAQALVQEADLLLLDEPTAHLDVQYQFSVLQEVQALVAAGRTVITVFHDLERAARYAERLLILDEGRLVADGAPRGVLTPDCIADVFGMEARVEPRSEGGVHIDYVGPVSGSEDGAAQRSAASVTNS
jgi:iron complex transport system ATP-binding protein